MTQIIAITMFVLWMLVIALVLLAVPVVIIGGLCYAVGGPEVRMKMIGWAPGVQHGVKKTLGLARALQNQSPEEAE